MLARHVVPITPSLPVRLAPLLGYKQNEQTNFHSPYTLPSSVSCKSGVCHSYENTGGVGVFFPFWNSLVSCCGFDAGNERLSKSSTNYCHRITDHPSIGLHRPYQGHHRSCFKSFTCNTYGPPCKCCKQKTYCLAKSFRCNTYKKEGWGCLFREHRTSPREGKPGIPRVDRSGPIPYFLSTIPFPCFFTSLPHYFYPFHMRENSKMFATVEEAVEEIRQGRMVVLVDDEDRENEGDLAMAAEKITPDAINFMAKHGRGLICLPLTEERCDELHLPLMSPINTSVHGTAFTEAVDARVGVTTGISASDRAITILTAIDPKTKPQDLARPGHIFPLRARKGGVLVRAGQTEASVDLARIAGMSAAGVICEIMNEDGTMARVPQLIEFCKEHNLKMLTVADLIRYRMQHERYVRRVAEAVLPTRFGDFRMVAYASDVDHDQHVALVRGDLEGAEPALVRVHSHCLTGDVFGSTACDCNELVSRSLEAIAKENRGVFLYLHHTGRGFSVETAEEPGVLPQIHFHKRGQLDREPARQRMVQHESGIGAQILIDLGLKDIRVLTNHPKKVVALEGYGIRIADQVPLRLETPKPSHQVL